MLLELKSYGVELFRESGFWIFSAILASQFARAQHLYRFHKLKKAFGKAVSEPNGIRLSLSIWHLAKSARDDSRFTRVRPSGAEASFYGPSDVFSGDDLRAAMQVVDLFAPYFSEPIAIETDSTDIDWAGRTGILIGMSNFHAENILASVTASDTKLPVEVCECVENEKQPYRYVIKDVLRGKIYRSEDQFEYAVIYRLNISSTRTGHGYVFIVAGVHATGTLGAAIYLRNNWEILRNKQGDCALIIRLHANQPKTAELESRTDF